MNPDQPKPLAVFGVGYLTTFTTQDGRLILQDMTDLTIVEPNGKHWDVTTNCMLRGWKEFG